MIMIDTGDRIAAKAAQMARPEFIAAYPITPQTVIVEKTAEYVEMGELTASTCASKVNTAPWPRSSQRQAPGRERLPLLLHTASP